VIRDYRAKPRRRRIGHPFGVLSDTDSSKATVADEAAQGIKDQLHASARLSAEDVRLTTLDFLRPMSANA
jgi:hypothetical protein